MKIERTAQRRIAELAYEVSAFRQVLRFTAYNAMQNTLAGMNPNCEVLRPMRQMTTLLIAASTHPSQHLLPTRIVEQIVSKQDK
jgi:hypothetical protein